MLLGARQFFERRGAPTPSAPTARDYVQDGLIAMWDGIENAGWGTHDATATTWKNLAGEDYDWIGVLGGYDIGYWADDAYVFYKQPAEAQYITQTWNIQDSQVAQIEVCSMLTGGKYGACMFFSDTRQRYIAIENTRMTFGLSAGMGITDGSSFLNRKMSASVSIGNEILHAYIDNEAVNTTNGAYWGKYRNFATFGRDNGNNMLGYVYCVRLYSRASTAAEIARNYEIDKARFNLP